ncbi:MAG: energy transducer TonB [Armatimonadota bacterium]|nr:energy transducer TonB [Armatimonadota bacterium]MDR7465316.1 energy transducer TonB [Armatimonadota bacterium]MDR7470264.1 energy transducer TonB [Armatimonadota bacterium]MDR7473421.1 energy transducer TonB [Armatimonadota bacterium]MDR7538410.1 energy transducer TonB [Armatimonadota bacterium]
MPQPPAGAAGGPSRGEPSPVLTPPVPVEQPPLHPVLRAVVVPGPGGMAAGQATVRGRVRVRLLVLADGTVAEVEVLISSGDPELDQAARQGLLRWRFLPARRDGVPVDAHLLLWVTFGE